MIGVHTLRDLIQERYYPDEFKVLVCCLLLNRCCGETVRGVVDKLFERFPDAASRGRGCRGAHDDPEAARLSEPTCEAAH